SSPSDDEPPPGGEENVPLTERTLPGNVGAELPDVAVQVDERCIAPTPRTVDRPVDDRYPALRELPAERIGVIGGEAQLRGCPRARFGDGHPPEHLGFRLTASQKAQEDVVELEDDRAVPLIDAGDIEDLFVERLRAQRIFDEQRDHVD